MDEREVIVSCYLNGCIKYGTDGVYYEGSTHNKIGFKRNTKFNRLLVELYSIFGLDKETSKFEIFGRYPVVALSLNQFRYAHFPVVDDCSFEAMLEVPSNHSSIKSVEFYLEVKPTSDDVTDPGSSSKRRRILQPEEDNGSEVQANADFGNGSTHGGGDTEMRDNNSGSGAVVQVVNDLNKDSNSCVLKPCVSILWLGDHDLRVGLCFSDIDELKKAVNWFSIKRQQKCVVREIGKDEFMFECLRWKCKWSLRAAKLEKHGLFEITKYLGPHTCIPTDPEDFKSEFEADEIERLLRIAPTLTIEELESCWFERFGYDLETSETQDAKQEAIKKIYGDWDESFRELPKLMAAFQSSNGLVVDWQYDPFPNPEFASFRGVFWAFPQSIEGFQHCRPLIVVDTKDLKGKYPMKLMIASGYDAEDCYFPLAFAVTKEVSSDSWRWFLTVIREKVTQRKGLCLVSSPHPDILAVINEPESRWQEPWAYHRFCLDHLCSQIYDAFEIDYLEGWVRQAGYTRKEDDFNSDMENIKYSYPEARRWLDQFPPHQWARAHDIGHRRYGFMTTNIEDMFSFFENVDSLCLTVTETALILFDELRLNFQNGMSDSRGMLKLGDMYTEPVLKELEEFRTTSVTYLVMPVENNMFQVTIPLEKDGWRVQLGECTSCTCGKFQMAKIPCIHALAVCEKLKINPLQYVDDCYTVERYYKTYSAQFNPVPEVAAWPEASGVPTLFPPVIPPLAPKVAASQKLSFVKRKSNTTKPSFFKRKEPSKDKEQSESALKEKKVCPEASGVPTLFPPVIPPPAPKVAGKPKKSDTSPKPSSKKKEPSKDKEPTESASSRTKPDRS